MDIPIFNTADISVFRICIILTILLTLPLRQARADIQRTDSTLSCPEGCICPGEYEDVFEENTSLSVECTMPTLNNTAIRMVPGIVTSLSLICDLSMCGDTDCRTELENDVFSHLTRLVSLTIMECRLYDIPPSGVFNGLYELKSLEFYSIKPYMSSHAPFSLSAQHFASLLSLHHLSLINCFENTNVMYIDGGALCGLETLRILTMKNNSHYGYYDMGIWDWWEETPANSRLNLHILDISYNQVDFLPNEMGVAIPNLEILRCSYCGLTQLAELANLTNLRELDVSDNYISLFAPGIFYGLHNLEVMILSNNMIKDDWFKENKNVWVALAEPSLSGVKKLDVHNNEISLIKRGYLNYLPGLIELNLSQNNISHIQARSFSSCGLLQSLDVSHNRLLILTQETFVGLDNLKFLNLSCNDIAWPDDEVLPQQLEVLDISRTELRSLFFNNNSRMEVRILNISENPLTNFIFFSRIYNIEVLTISYTGLSEEDLQSFTNMQNIYYLDCTGNNITELGYTFAGWTSLTYLMLDKNNITSLAQPSLTYLRNLTNFTVSHNAITHLDKTTFPDCPLTFIDLSYNKISIIRPFTFSHLRNLTKVDLRYNRIRHLMPESVLVSQAIYRAEILLSNNDMACHCENEWLYSVSPSGHPQTMSGNDSDIELVSAQLSDYQPPHCAVEEDMDFLTNKIKVQELYCQYSQMHNNFTQAWSVCPLNCRCYVEVGKMKMIANCHDQNMSSIPLLSADLTVIDLHGNEIRTISQSDFSHAQNVEVLYLHGSRVQSIQSDAFNYISNLTELYLNNNLLSCLVIDFSHNSKLKKIDLSSNQLNYISTGTLPMYQLQWLSLKNNSISLLPGDFENASDAYKEMWLSENPWLCDCTNGPALVQWVVKYMEILSVEDADDMWCHTCNESCPTAHPGPLPNSSQGALCDNSHVAVVPETFAMSLLLRADFHECNTYRVAQLSFLDALIVVITLSIVIAASACLIYANRELLQIWLYTYYGFRLGGILEDDNTPYDAFISYSHHDSEWVCDHLIHRLDQTFRTIVAERDWLIGGSITDSIVESVTKSKRMILILSDHFVNSDWCSFEFRTAHHTALQAKKNRIIVVLLNDEVPHNLDPILTLYTSTHTYLKVNDVRFWDKLMYAMPRVEDREQAVA